ncbi:hypothetical protein KAX17_03410 [Candidatus Bipolaricaulota bacterium]|nr:hypothetical protein [Candidatus Bipolaricaulota bacterium]
MTESADTCPISGVSRADNGDTPRTDLAHPVMRTSSSAQLRSSLDPVIAQVYDGSTLLGQYRVFRNAGSGK